MEDKDLNYLFNEVPLYTKEVFEIFYEENNQYFLNESELDEEECKDYYEYLKAVINMQLQHEKEKYEEEQQSKMLTKAISNIVQRLKK